MSGLESALLAAVAGHDFEDALAALAATKARLQTRMVQESMRSTPFGSSTKKLLTAREVAARLGVSVKTVYSRKHDLGFVRIGRSVRFGADAVQRALEEGSV